MAHGANVWLALCHIVWHLCAMQNDITVHSVTNKVPAKAICDRFGVKDRSIRLARERGFFPSSWYLGMKELCAKHKAGFSDDLFNWKTSEASGTIATPIKRGNDSCRIQEQSPKKVDEARP